MKTPFLLIFFAMFYLTSHKAGAEDTISDLPQTRQLMSRVKNAYSSVHRVAQKLTQSYHSISTIRPSLLIPSRLYQMIDRLDKQLIDINDTASILALIPHIHNAMMQIKQHITEIRQILEEKKRSLASLEQRFAFFTRAISDIEDINSRILQFSISLRDLKQKAFTQLHQIERCVRQSRSIELTKQLENFSLGAQSILAFSEKLITAFDNAANAFIKASNLLGVFHSLHGISKALRFLESWIRQMERGLKELRKTLDTKVSMTIPISVQVPNITKVLKPKEIIDTVRETFPVKIEFHRKLCEMRRRCVRVLRKRMCTDIPECRLIKSFRMEMRCCKDVLKKRIIQVEHIQKTFVLKIRPIRITMSIRDLAQGMDRVRSFLPNQIRELQNKVIQIITRQIRIALRKLKIDIENLPLSAQDLMKAALLRQIKIPQLNDLHRLSLLVSEIQQLRNPTTLVRNIVEQLKQRLLSPIQDLFLRCTGKKEPSQ
jgi:hypothetical protein